MRWRPAARPGPPLGRPPLPRSRRLLYWIESIGMRLALSILGALPLDLVSAAGGRLIRAIGPHLRASRVGRDNLRQAWPDKTPAEIEALLRGVWDNLGRTVAEYPHLLRICDYRLLDDRPAARPRIEVVGLEHLVDLALDGRPGLFFSGHLANWELPPIGALDNGLAVTVLIRPPNNPYAAKLVHQLRNAAGTRLLPTTMESALTAVELLERGDHVGLLVDQHFGRRRHRAVLRSSGAGAGDAGQAGLSLRLPGAWYAGRAGGRRPVSHHRHATARRCRARVTPRPMSSRSWPR